MGPLIIFLLVDSPSDPLEDFPLELSHQLDHQVITRLHRKVKKGKETLRHYVTSSKAARAPALKKMMVWPSRYRCRSKPTLSRRA